MRLYLYKDERKNSYLRELVNGVSVDTYWDGKWYDFIIKGMFGKYRDEYIQIYRHDQEPNKPFFFIQSEELIKMVNKLNEKRKTLRRI